MSKSIKSGPMADAVAAKRKPVPPPKSSRKGNTKTHSVVCEKTTDGEHVWETDEKGVDFCSACLQDRPKAKGRKTKLVPDTAHGEAGGGESQEPSAEELAAIEAGMDKVVDDVVAAKAKRGRKPKAANQGAEETYDPTDLSEEEPAPLAHEPVPMAEGHEAAPKAGKSRIRDRISEVAEALDSPKSRKPKMSKADRDAAIAKTSKRVLKAKPPTAKTGSGPKAKKVGKLSQIDAAAEVLKHAKSPLSAKEIVERMVKQGLWSSPGGATPDATLASAIGREMGKLGKKARFRKPAPGRFELA